MGSHFHDWIDYNGVAFSIEFNTSTHFRIFRGETVLHIYGYCYETYQNVRTVDEKCCSLNLNWSQFVKIGRD